MIEVRAPRAAAGCALALTLSVLGSAHGAGPQGSFAIKGLGASDCATAEREYRTGTPNAMMYGGWIYGYMTAMNQLTPDTFDLAPWQDLNTLTSFVVEYCKKNPGTSFAQAVMTLVAALKPKRLAAETAPTKISVNGKDYMLYAEAVNRMASALRAKGHLKGKPEADQPRFTAELSKALKAFQASRKLPATGEPDQMTLFELFER